MGTTIHRINNDGNYEPGNCKWATVQEQNENSRHARILELNGERMPLRQWALKAGVHEDTLRNRLRAGLSVVVALTTPPQYGNKGWYAKAIDAARKDKG